MELLCDYEVWEGDFLPVCMRWRAEVNWWGAVLCGCAAWQCACQGVPGGQPGAARVQRRVQGGGGEDDGVARR